MKSRKLLGIILMLSFMLLSSVPLSSASEVINPEFILPRDVYKYGGEFIFPRDADFPNINPFLGTGATWWGSQLIYESLLMIGPDWQVYPYLAKSWEISEDGLTYTFHLQEDVTWSDGMPLTSEDVKFTFDGWVTHEIAQMQPYSENIENIEAPDPYTVVFTLKQKDVLFLDKLAFPSLTVAPKHIWKDIEDWSTWANDDPELAIGSGPFILEEWKKGEYVELVANENYWMGRPYVDKVIFVVINMRDMQKLAFLKGEVDIFWPLPNELSEFLKPEYHIYQQEDVGLPWFYPNHLRRPGNDTAFRHAMQYVVDRDMIYTMAHYGFGVMPTHMLPHPYEEGGWIPPETAIKPFDLAMAAEILDEAGYLDVDEDGWREYPDGDKMELELSVSDTERYLKAAEVIIDGMQSININVKMDVVGGGQFGQKVLVNRDIDLTYWRCGPGMGSPLEPLEWLTSWGYNWLGWYNDTYDDLWNQASQQLDPEDQRPLIFEMQRVLAENYVFVPHVTNVYLKVINKDKWDPLPGCLPYGPWTNCQMFHYYNNPLEGVYVDFDVADLHIGSSVTDSEGTAEFTWVPMEQGSFEVKARFAGTSEYKDSESDAKTLTVGAAPTPTPTVTPTPTPTPPPKADNTMYYIAGAVIIIIIAAAALFMRKS